MTIPGFSMWQCTEGKDAVVTFWESLEYPQGTVRTISPSFRKWEEVPTQWKFIYYLFEGCWNNKTSFSTCKPGLHKEAENILTLGQSAPFRQVIRSILLTALPKKEAGNVIIQNKLSINEKLSLTQHVAGNLLQGGLGASQVNSSCVSTNALSQLRSAGKPL